MKVKPLSQSVIASMRETFTYEPDTGHIIRVKAEDHRRRHLIGKPCGSVSKTTGYIQLTHHKRSYMAHRVVFVLMTGEWPTDVVDHINRCKTDNRWANLRLCNRTESSTNISISRRNKTGVRGVQYWPERDRWIAMIHANGKKHWLGSFKTKEEAVAARIAGGLKHHGEFPGEVIKSEAAR